MSAYEFVEREADHQRAALVVGALERAVWNRRPRGGVIHHSGDGCQYPSLLFGEHCQKEMGYPNPVVA